MWNRIGLVLNTTAAAYNLGSDDNAQHLLGSLNLALAILFTIDLLKN